MQHTWGAPLTPVRPQSLQGGLPYRSFTILLPMIFSFSPLYRFGVFFPLWNEILIFPHSFIDQHAPVTAPRAQGRRTGALFPISINLTVVVVLLFSFKFLRLFSCFQPWVHRYSKFGLYTNEFGILGSKYFLKLVWRFPKVFGNSQIHFCKFTTIFGDFQIFWT